MTKKLTGSETPEQIDKFFAQANFELVVKFLRGEHEKVLTAKEQMSIWELGDGFGELSLAQVAETEFDWSHIRDSSPAAQAAMAQKIRDILAARAHPGKQFCPKCLDSGLHLPEGS